MKKQKFLYLSTTGHRSGNSHEIEIWYVEHDGCFYIVSEKREAAHWVRNIRADPNVRFHLGEDWDADASAAEGTASVPEDASLIAAVKAKMDDKYGWSDGLVVAVCGK